MDGQFQLQPKNLTKSQRKWVLASFILFIIFFVLVGTLSFADNLFGETIQRRKESLKKLQERGFDFSMLLNSQEQERQELIKQKRTDSDSDGLSDYDELHVYLTSPYLKDSDSDGISDADELQSGKNPNCNESRIRCFEPTQEEIQKIEKEVIKTDEEELKLLQDVLNLEGLKNELRASLTPDQMRNVLYRQGFDPSIVNSLTAQDLIGLRESFLSPELKVDIGAILESEDINLESLDIEMLKNILIAGGISKEMINLIPENILVDLYNETTKEVTAPVLEESLLFGTNQNL